MGGTCGAGGGEAVSGMTALGDNQRLPLNRGGLKGPGPEAETGESGTA